ncbi:MAG TPA: efflux RND transporter periplasmic adaptor subunit [Rhizomicrobium sp.]|nr:efflux RND transporter periplasmic adaptor subunit [Rhizomicrobium sp.]
MVAPVPDQDIASRLELGTKRRRRWVWWVVGIVVLLLVVVVLMASMRGGQAHNYVTKAVTRGNLAVVVSATGTLAPRDQVDVGAEVSGRIDALSVDFNDHVAKGQVLARINTDQLEAQLQQAKATLETAQATLEQMTQTHQRYEALAKGNAMSKEQLNVSVGDLARAKAGVALARAQVDQDQTALSKATIYSPIDGVVLDRKVSVGQTVVAALQTPVLFTLASDLNQMELDVDIDEADVGEVRAGSHATFTVDAYPARKFQARLVSVHSAPKTVQGVVTYQGVLLVHNEGGLLKPGMTATAEIDAANVKDALLVPNTALRYVPPDDVKQAGGNPPPVLNGVSAGRVWLKSGTTLKPHDLKLGPTDGRSTQVLSSDLKPGDQVVTDNADKKPGEQ